MRIRKIQVANDVSGYLHPNNKDDDNYVLEW